VPKRRVTLASRIHARRDAVLHVVQDRLRIAGAARARVIEAIEAALRVGQGRVDVHPHIDEEPRSSAVVDKVASAASVFPWRFSTDLHCADCDVHYQDPNPSLFSFNSPIGACDTCRGFGRVIGVDYGLVVPDAAKTLRQGAIKPWQTPSFRECQDDLIRYAKKRGIALDTPWCDLDDHARRWVLDGESEWVSWSKSWPGTWYGVTRFFAWLESKAYKMHVPIPDAQPVMGRDSSPRHCCGAWVPRKMPMQYSRRDAGSGLVAAISATTSLLACPGSRCTIS